MLSNKQFFKSSLATLVVLFSMCVFTSELAYAVDNTSVTGPDGTQVEVPKPCSRLSGLERPVCNSSEIGELCDMSAVVCNNNNTGLTQRDKNEYKRKEKSAYCLLPSNYCFNETLWGEGGLEEYRDQRIDDAYEDLADGDLGGFLCNSLDAVTEGFIGCEEEADSHIVSYDLPLEETTFTQFDAEFSPPSPDGYSAGLVESTGIREYVLKVTDFVLGFLGLLAVLIIIYGGFTYITAAGDEGKTETGKNAIKFSVIGIVIIFGAFALVRTLICYLPVGGDDRPSFCRSGGAFSIGSSATSPSIQSESLSDDGLTTIENAKAKLQEIAYNAINVSDVYQKVQIASDYFPSIELALADGLSEASNIIDSLYAKSTGLPLTTKTLDVMSQYLGRQKPIALESNSSFARSILASVLSSSSTKGPSYSDITSDEFEDVYDFMDVYSVKLLESMNSDYDNVIDDLVVHSQNLEALFDKVEKPRQLLEDVTASISALKTAKADVLKLKTMLTNINEAFATIEKLEFVKVKINTTTRRCSAPCVVLFDSIGSIDPSNQTILDSSHSWDLDGDGVYDEASTTCSEEALATVSCMYEIPGTYVASLRVDSSDPTRFPSGLSFVKIEVTRPLSKIKVNLTTPSGVDMLVMDNTVTPAVRNSPIKYTVEQARAGITFDASGSLNSSGAPITEFVWSIGTEVYEGNNPSKTFTFTTKGTYRVSLEVKDVAVTERAIIILDIGSPAAHFELINESAAGFQTGQTIQFDGSFSKSDNGSIGTYQWSVYKGEELIKEASSVGPDFSFIPDSPGSYRVILAILDSVGEADTIEKTFVVESQSPTACFTHEIVNPLTPGTVHLYNCSTDPDLADELGYEWTVEGGEFIEGTTSSSENPIVRFVREGKHAVTLRVNDLYIEEVLRKTDEVTQEVELESVLDIDLDFPNGLAYQLDDVTGKTAVDFTVTSTTANYYEVDFGDGSEKQGAQGEGEMTFSHDYTQAGVYNVIASVFNEDNERNFIIKRLFIGSSNSPLPVISLSVGTSQLDTSSTLSVSKNVPVTFDGGDSLNRDGSGRNLLYSINFGDGTVDSQKLSTHIYDEIGVYNITFTVTDEGSGVSGSIPLTLNVVDAPPKVRSLTSQITSGDITTPVDISVITDSVDSDGRIVQYTWYLYDADNTSSPLETQVSNTERTQFTFHGVGVTGEEHKVYICVKVKDDGDNETDSCTDGPYTYISTFTGENDPPVAKFSVADSTVKVGDPVIFYDESTDDTEIVEVYYDVLGNGFADDIAQNVHSYSHEYAKIGIYEVRIKAIDTNGASSVSPKKTIVVESSVDEPVAKILAEVEDLVVKFTDNSTIDSDTYNAYRVWDFDIRTDTDGDGVTDNDVDSTSESPNYSYSSSGKYTAKLSITDGQGNTDSVEKSFDVSEPELEARLLLTPAPDASDNKVHLTGNQATVRADFSDSVGNIKRYVLDGNALYDSNGNGINDDDADQSFTSPREAMFVYKREWKQPFVIRLTVYDHLGNSASVSKTALFDPIPTEDTNNDN